MGLFGTKSETEQLIAQLRHLNDRLDAASSDEAPALAEEVVTLKKKVASLEIQKSQKEEEFNKREREIDHRLGLERKRMDFEREEAAKNAAISVREEALVNKQEAFDANMQFMRDRFEQEISGWRDMYKTVFDKVPTVTVDRQIRENHGVIEAPADDVE